MKTLRYFVLAMAFIGLCEFAAFGQKTKVTVIDTLHFEGAVYELGQVSLADMHIDVKRHSYVDLVKRAQKMGWDLCPADSASMRRIATKVHLEPENRKFCAYVATVPITDPESWRMKNAFWITEIASMSDGAPNRIGYEDIGYFGTTYFKEMFPVLDDVGTFGYLSLSRTPSMVRYDWVFMRPLSTTKN